MATKRKTQSARDRALDAASRDYVRRRNLAHAIHAWMIGMADKIFERDMAKFERKAKR